MAPENRNTEISILYAAVVTSGKILSVTTGLDGCDRAEELRRSSNREVRVASCSSAQMLNFTRNNGQGNRLPCGLNLYALGPDYISNPESVALCSAKHSM